MQTIRNNLSSINNIVKEISLKKNIVEFPNIKKFNYKSDEINIKNLSYSYPNTMKTSLNSINMTIKKRGNCRNYRTKRFRKEHFVRHHLGVIAFRKDKNISIFGNKLNTSAQSWQKEIGYVSQNIYLTDDTIKKNIALGIEDNLMIKKVI